MPSLLKLCSLSLAWTISLAGCSGPDKTRDSKLATATRDAPLHASAATVDRWNFYVAETTSVARADQGLSEAETPFQKSCAPTYFPNQAKTYRGLVVAYHGYSACPQHFFEWAPQLAAAGFDVFLPILPGHGYRPKADGTDNIDFLPDESDYLERYSALASTMADLANQTPYGTKVVAGLSVGGTVAMLTGMIKGPRNRSIFDRQLIMVPFFELGSAVGKVKYALNLTLGKLPYVRDNVYSWDEDGETGCRDSLRPDYMQATYGLAARGGYCTFKARQINANRYLGQYVFGRLNDRTSHFSGQSQFVVVENDPAAYTYRTREAIMKLVNPQARLGACSYRASVNHSLMSRYDAPQEDKLWFETVMREATAFVATGRHFSATDQVLDPGIRECSCPDCYAH